MKKRNRKKLNDKVLLFPGLEKRLLEKGLESLQQKRFREAVDFLEEAMTLEQENSDIHIGLVLAYFESGQLTKAKELANTMLQKGIGDYIQIIDLYLMILVQLHQYDEIVKTIEILIEEKEIPEDKIEHFTRMLQFSKRMAESSPNIHTDDPTGDEPLDMKIDLFSIEDQHGQIQMASMLTNRNLKPYINEIKAYLESSEGQPFFKTMLLNVLIEHEYDKDVIVQKLGERIIVKPSNLQGAQHNSQMDKLLNIVAKQLEHEDPILFEHIKSLIERHLFILYPFQLKPFSEDVWGAAYHHLAAEYQGLNYSIKETALRYNVTEKEIGNAGAFLKKIEEISSLNY
ncbi:tetratricopeptide repeat protein [Bacillus sp. DTU_2020_1000418_1_SI_GHA_SEK_038]|uniref:tetratricopeptide repeat protein n=1 Tax=Bacillus sp. DTU_2020_1000418_1_SI_GHA_SEK_038 TaxID=3077585 RepID=UPI0028E7BACC|nr:tetratricopeptide repeat protein [Bacillus sp. DTU_2020_1000418_1_SI_GHA_SEK_038]WNS74495.1 tetratricopeptide repeat protein [Bacillus sp. DTU_2020_1000418_1_SI_GHA_SEK_038]